jgi:hypothetical protein
LAAAIPASLLKIGGLLSKTMPLSCSGEESCSSIGRREYRKRREAPEKMCTTRGTAVLIANVSSDARKNLRAFLRAELKIQASNRDGAKQEQILFLFKCISAYLDKVFVRDPIHPKRSVKACGLFWELGVRYKQGKLHSFCFCPKSLIDLGDIS